MAHTMHPSISLNIKGSDGKIHNLNHISIAQKDFHKNLLIGATALQGTVQRKNMTLRYLPHL